MIYTHMTGLPGKYQPEQHRKIGPLIERIIPQCVGLKITFILFQAEISLK